MPNLSSTVMPDLEAHLGLVMRIHILEGQGREATLAFMKVLVRQLEASPVITANFLPVSRLLSAAEELMRAEEGCVPPKAIECIRMAFQILEARELE